MDDKRNVNRKYKTGYHFVFAANSFSQKEKCDLLIEPYNLHDYSNRELEKAEEIFDQGYKTTGYSQVRQLK